MSVNVGHVFARVSDIERLRSAIGDYLRLPPANDDHAQFPREKLFNDGGCRKVVLLPPMRGWSTILESEHRAADIIMAQGLSKYFSARTIWFKVSGCVFDFEWIIFENGDLRQRGALRERYSFGNEMPIYQDAEMLAWEQALKWGIPSQTLFLKTEVLQLQSDSNTKATFFEVRRDSDNEVKAYESPLRMPIEPVEPRSYLDAVITLDANAAPTTDNVLTATEMRFLYGNPSKQSLSNLEMLLRRVQSRYSRVCRLPKERIKFFVRCGDSASMEITLPPDLQI